MNTKKLGFAAFMLGFVGACATASGPDIDGLGGDDGIGGEGGTAGASNGTGGAAMTSSSSSSGNASSSGSSSSSSASSSSSGGPVCGASEHLCSGTCTGNTPASGCFTSQTCSECAAVQNGSPMCTPQGSCDVSCNAGYQKNGNACVCSSMCCKDTDCASGQTCMGGTCSGGGGTCDSALCVVLCFAQGGKLGICSGNVCTCL